MDTAHVLIEISGGRHLCDREKFCFGDLDTDAYNHYVTEIHGKDGE